MYLEDTGAIHLNQTRRIIILMLMCFVLIFSMTFNVSGAEQGTWYEKPARFLLGNQQFNQYIEFNYDQSFINQSLAIEKSLVFPLEIIYWTDLPVSLKDPGFWRLRLLYIIGLFDFTIPNYIIYGMGMPQQSLILNVTSKPSWLDCNFIIDTIPVESIPTFDDTSYRNKKLRSEHGDEVPFIIDISDDDKLVIRTNLVISPLVDAPARQYSIGISAYLKPMGMLKSSLFFENITFTPSFFPKIDFEVNNPLIISSPQESVNFEINITNSANKVIQVIPKLANSSQSNEEINPDMCTLFPNESTTFYFSKFTNNELGWYDISEEYTINFYVRLAPFTSNTTYGPYPITISLHTYGFSTPGFDSVAMSLGFLILILCLFIKRKRVYQ